MKISKFQVAVVFGIARALRRIELTNLRIIDVGTVLIVRVPERIFTISNEKSIDIGNMGFIDIYRKYVALRPANITHDRLFLSFRKGKCTAQAVGVNTFGKLPFAIAQFFRIT